MSSTSHAPLDRHGLPIWWNAARDDGSFVQGRKRVAIFSAAKVATTYDLVLLAFGADSGDERPAEVCISVQKLFAYCNAKLHGMRMCLREARGEPGVKVKAHFPHTELIVTRPDLLAKQPPAAPSLSASPPRAGASCEAEPLALSSNDDAAAASSFSSSNSDDEATCTAEAYGWTAEDLHDYPPELLCPLTLEPFRDPVLLVEDGYTYERSEIEAWLRKKEATSPMTGEVIASPHVVPNRAIADMMARLAA